MATALHNVSPYGVLVNQLRQARQVTDQLFAIVRPNALYERPIGERHRIIFYVGHLEAFDWNLFRDRLFSGQAENPQLDQLFAFGIDPVDGGLPIDQESDWPSVQSVSDYVQRTRSAVDQGLRSIDGRSDFKRFVCDPAQLLNVAVEHRLMHAETLAYMLHQLPLDKKLMPYDGQPVVARAVQPEMVRIPAGQATLGLARDSGEFGWDNEFEEQTVDVPAFDIGRYMVTNGEYLDFIGDRGYHTAPLWTEADWRWRTTNNIEHPVFWKRLEGGWACRTMFQEIALPLDWPVYVSHAEARAFAKWAGRRLPSEAEWHRAAYGDLNGDKKPYPWGDRDPDARLGNFNFRGWDPTPVGSFPHGESMFGVSDLLGNGWEWTETLFAPLPGFQAFSFYEGYSANFFDGKHYILKGGSSRTASSMLRRSFRNWFQPHYQYVYAGFRCVGDAQ